MEVNIRPFARVFLKNMAKIYEVGVFTAAHACYANEVIKSLDPKGKYIKLKLTRKNCIEVEPNIFVKDLRVIRNRRLEDILIVDNFAHSYALQLDNGVPCIPFYDDEEDEELVNLDNYLRQLEKSKDMILVNSKHFKNFMLLDANDAS